MVRISLSTTDMSLLKRLRCALFSRESLDATEPQGAGYQPLPANENPAPTYPRPPAPKAPPKPHESIERELASLRARVGKLERLAKE